MIERRLVSSIVERIPWHVEHFSLRNGALGQILGCRSIHNNPFLTVLSIVAIEQWLQKLSVVSYLSATGRGVGYLSHLPKSVFKTSRIAALGTRLSRSTNTICQSQLQSSSLAHAWAGYVIGVSSCPCSIKSILPRIYPLHHVRDVVYQALLSLYCVQH